MRVSLKGPTATCLTISYWLVETAIDAMPFEAIAHFPPVHADAGPPAELSCDLPVVGMTRLRDPHRTEHGCFFLICFRCGCISVDLAGQLAKLGGSLSTLNTNRNIARLRAAVCLGYLHTAHNLLP